ncbi:hypothetical protein GCM10011529_20560 [Polymorphobacter glacialis]|uniref:DUF2125 domain-containing protein n=1 Tax=Sandarakinorhabdus glacialis TaxID=1614636 RepID=A0A916ZTY6_9SPHN|nr:hypothetical protein [Polymorphobacter glacialis]GGE14022.1 hypothetical protein GCM10011529_20560 [Polymorphobacter glacialis]
MSRRIPLWLTLVPLIAALAIYFWLWSGWARAFKAVLTHWLPGTEIAVTGFPYRLESNPVAPRISLGETVKITITAAQARINRGPWRPELTVIGAETPSLSVIVSPLLSASITGKSVQTSVHIQDARLTRLSSVITGAVARLGLTAAPITADTLELHLRERTPGPKAVTGPTETPRGQLVITGKALRLGAGDPLSLAADITVTGAARLLGYDAWATTGTLELDSLKLSDPTGEIASAKATITPIGRTGIRFAGTIDTVCPATIAAALQAQPALTEKRLRAPLRLTFEGTPASLRITGLPADLATRATRNQLPPCPKARGTGAKP